MFNIIKKIVKNVLPCYLINRYRKWRQAKGFSPHDYTGERLRKIKGVLKKNKTIFKILKRLYYTTWRASVIFENLISNKKRFEHNLAIAAIIKNEASYLKEWIEYHKFVGVDYFYIYDNYSTDSTKNVLQPYIDAGKVKYTLFPDKGGFHTLVVQREAYNDAINRYKKSTKWLALIDVDEFIVPLKNNNITKLLKANEKPNIPAIEILWVLYGYSGNYRKPKGLVIENYTKSSDKTKLNELPNGWEWLKEDYCKSIINPRMVIKYDVHVGLYKANFKGKQIDKNIIRINHYWTKSYEELCEKLNRNKDWQPNSGEKYKIIPEYDGEFLSNIEDNVMEKYVNILKEKL
jgi:hypothetical protein